MRFIRALPLSLALILVACASGCALDQVKINKELTPQRCAAAVLGSTTVEMIAHALEEHGVKPTEAQLLAEGIKAGRIAITKACEKANNHDPALIPDNTQPVETSNSV